MQLELTAQPELDLSTAIADLNSFIRNNIKNDKLVQLFYRVDLNEKILSKSLAQGDIQVAVSEIVALILKREFQKVILRQTKWD